MFMKLHQYRRRVEREVNEMDGYFDIKLIIIPNKEMCIYVYDTCNRILKLYINNDYPFSMPKLTIANKYEMHEDVYWKVIQHISAFYISKLGINHNPSFCLCCHTLCNDWTPSRRMLHMIRECEAMESWFRDLRSAYYGKKTLSIKKVYKYNILHICSYIYDDVPRLQNYFGSTF